ncbi:hypothetical protein FHR22_004271 [Sphingopyxis panaciterrae]|uniref:hypothetical protein n=1 Tax=Sphingopyxis panaciterrae TaxID=363841 RepID=UPI00141E6D92|nr:hypothetical protein [Sphingopyxis panaciterrae]NIJ39521.1 hypothetical protein [Sphingopyxis panaciterrae]
MQQVNGSLNGNGAKIIGEELARWLPSLRLIYTESHKLSANFPGTAPEKNIAFRKHLHKQWRIASAKGDKNEKIRLAKHYVFDWGGVRSNKDETIERYASMHSRDLISLGMQGISSWSKIISLHSPRQYPIYDARVALSLNAMQAVLLGEIRLWFNIPSTQIKTIPIEAKRLRNLRVDGCRIRRKETYKTYLAYLDEMGLGRRRQRTELLLFSASPRFVDLLSAVPCASFNGATLQALLPALRQAVKV